MNYKDSDIFDNSIWVYELYNRNLITIENIVNNFINLIA